MMSRDCRGPFNTSVGFWFWCGGCELVVYCAREEQLLVKDVSMVAAGILV